MVLRCVGEAVEEQVDGEEEEAPCAVSACDSGTGASVCAVVVPLFAAAAAAAAAALRLCLANGGWVVQCEDDDAGRYRSDNCVLPERIPPAEERDVKE